MARRIRILKGYGFEQIAIFTARFDAIESRIGALESKIDGVSPLITDQLETMKTELKAEIAKVQPK